MTINDLTIDSTAENIDVTVTFDAGQLPTQLRVWTVDTYKVYADAINTINMDALFQAQVSGAAFQITAELLGVTKIEGIYFIEFTTNDGATANTQLGVVGNMIPHYECLLNKTLTMELVDCTKIKHGDCEDCAKNAPYIETLLFSVGKALILGYYDEAVKIGMSLNDACVLCQSCPTYTTITIVPGTGYNTVNNIIMEV